MVVDLCQRGLPAYCMALLDEVRERSGRPVRIIEEPGGLEFDSETRMARAGESEHTVAYRPEYRAHRTHFAVSSAMKLLRLYREPPERRLMPTVEPDATLPADEYQAFRRGPLVAHLPEAERRAMARYLWLGLVRQLTSFPVDLRVEREIAEALPEHAGRQQAYFRRQVADLVPHFAPEMARLAPPRSYRAISAMNVALGIEAAELAGVCEHRTFRKTLYRRVGEALHAELREVAHAGRCGDYLLTDAWASRLGFAGVYVWSAASSAGDQKDPGDPRRRG